VSIQWSLCRSLVRHRARTLAVDDSRSYTGKRLLGAALFVAAEIERRSDSDTVGVLVPTSGAFAVAALAGWMVGKVVVPLNYLLKRDELQYVIDHCQADTVLTATPLLDHLGFAPRCEHLVPLDTLSFGGVPEPRWPRCASPQDLACLLYTSGTSGKPKGVMLTHHNLLSNVRQVDRFVHFSRDRHTFLGVLPQFHSFGLTVMTILPLMLGHRVVYSARFVPQQIVRLFRQHRPTVFVAIPSMYAALLSVKNATADDFASLRFAVSGGEPLPRDVLERFEARFGVRIHEGYGLTETSPVTNWSRPSEWAPGSVGVSLPGVEQVIIDPDTDAPLPPNTDGEVRVRGPNIMRGYFKDPHETRKAFDRRGFFRTGDIGRLDTAGRLRITGRLKEMIIVGGENLFPREVEEALNHHPDVHASGVTSRSDPIRGEEVVAFVQPEQGRSIDPAALRSWVGQRLAGYKVPREIRAIDELPRSPTGKILRRDLKATLEREAGATLPA